MAAHLDDSLHMLDITIRNQHHDLGILHHKCAQYPLRKDIKLLVILMGATLTRSCIILGIIRRHVLLTGHARDANQGFPKAHWRLNTPTVANAICLLESLLLVPVLGGSAPLQNLIDLLAHFNTLDHNLVDLRRTYVHYLRDAIKRPEISALITLGNDL